MPPTLSKPVGSEPIRTDPDPSNNPPDQSNLTNLLRPDIGFVRSATPNAYGIFEPRLSFLYIPAGYSILGPCGTVKLDEAGLHHVHWRVDPCSPATNDDFVLFHDERSFPSPIHSLQKFYGTKSFHGPQATAKPQAHDGAVGLANDQQAMGNRLFHSIEFRIQDGYCLVSPRNEVVTLDPTPVYECLGGIGTAGGTYQIIPDEFLAQIDHTRHLGLPPGVDLRIQNTETMKLFRNNKMTDLIRPGLHQWGSSPTGLFDIYEAPHDINEAPRYIREAPRLIREASRYIQEAPPYYEQQPNSGFLNPDGTLGTINRPFEPTPVPSIDDIEAPGRQSRPDAITTPVQEPAESSDYPSTPPKQIGPSTLYWLKALDEQKMRKKGTHSLCPTPTFGQWESGSVSAGTEDHAALETSPLDIEHERSPILPIDHEVVSTAGLGPTPSQNFLPGSLKRKLKHSQGNDGRNDAKKKVEREVFKENDDAEYYDPDESEDWDEGKDDDFTAARAKRAKMMGEHHHSTVQDGKVKFPSMAPAVYGDETPEPMLATEPVSGRFKDVDVTIDQSHSSAKIVRSWRRPREDGAPMLTLGSPLIGATVLSDDEYASEQDDKETEDAYDEGAYEEEAYEEDDNEMDDDAYERGTSEVGKQEYGSPPTKVKRSESSSPSCRALPALRNA